MIKGHTIYQDIHRYVDQAQEDVDRVGTRLQEANGKMDRLRAEEARELARLARIRLEALAGNRIAEGLDAADRRALELLERRRTMLARTNRQIQDSQAEQESLGQERERVLAAVEKAQHEHHGKREATLQRLGETENYQFQLSAVERATSQAAHASEKAARAEADRAQKRQPYEKDKLFSYLWGRRYGFPQYRALPLFRSMDGWVARLCRYDQAHRDYRALLDIPDRLRTHADKLMAMAKAETELLAGLEREALAADGVPALAAALTTKLQALEAVEERIQAAEASHAEFLDLRGRLDAGTDPDSKNALAALTDQLDREDVATLRADARRTGTPEDDEVVAAIAELREEQAALEPRLADLRVEHHRAAEALKDVQKLRRRFRQRGFDSSESVFDSRFDIGDILGALLTGAMVFGDAWARVDRRQRFRRRDTSTGSDSVFGTLGGILSSSGSSSGGGFGGFGGGGGFSSGGGFSTGGGFGGGGGGFSTGGGF